MHTKFHSKSIELPPAINRLSELACNVWFSWNDSAKSLFSAIDPELWEHFGHNPVRLLMEVQRPVLDALAHNGEFLNKYGTVMEQYDHYFRTPTWFEQRCPEYAQKTIAYFSAEFGFCESLPIYSGGLGILAGDHCKSASDLGVPLVGIGLLYKKGYFRQKFDAQGRQLAESAACHVSRLPIVPALAPVQSNPPAERTPEELYVSLPMADRTVRLKVWQVQVGRVPVFLLDADLEDNSSWDRELTSQLYGGNQDVRIAQEILLGVGGVKALRALGIAAGTYHINEGHAAFLSFERLKEQLDNGLPFHVALEVVRASTIFTTHTPVPAGHDAFPLPMFEYYFSRLFAEYPHAKAALTELGWDVHKQLFNMTYLAMNTAALRNGVSKLHGHVSRDMFRAFHGNIDVHEVPIGHITNGVHLQTWLAPELKELYSRFLPETWISRHTDKEVWKSIDSIPEESLWSVHLTLKKRLFAHVHANLREQLRRNGMPSEKIEAVQTFLSPEALTIGFARRFATYKRATLIFTDLDRLNRLVNHPDRPVQFLFAGKAHPADHSGQEMIREIYRVSRMESFRGKIILLENYDMSLAQSLIQGVDVWLNNPRRPYEASGTSGQKAAMNGVINFSVPDGWWEEGYDGTNGWSIENHDHADPWTQDRENTESIYRLLEQEIVPLYYQHGPLPAQWVARMKRSIRTLAPVYNTDRMVMDYVNETYIPSLQRTQLFADNDYAEATKVADYKKFIHQSWHHVRVLEVNDTPPRTLNSPSGTTSTAPLKEVTATVRFGPIWYQDTAIELIHYEERPDGWHQVVVPMEPARQLGDGAVVYRAMIPSHLKHGPHFSIRVLPVSANFARRFEVPFVTKF
ncbi:DUF3417 domain-containing protein [Paenibacillus naphthalenovorans]|uniref:alpha-glucan family phosphorylase n=1 Tax=Paenibacillus naphthalenovorans TaxID=162209 RepID=UPI0010BA3902|nr:alpha-glucan family phosphorylase [Paenibacillus naphthalenovorans]GCL73069.1 DUF3417 domain-containing protein [Paenibacillus naphthalenovorans]